MLELYWRYFKGFFCCCCWFSLPFFSSVINYFLLSGCCLLRILDIREYEFDCVNIFTTLFFFDDGRFVGFSVHKKCMSITNSIYHKHTYRNEKKFFKTIMGHLKYIIDEQGWLTLIWLVSLYKWPVICCVCWWCGNTRLTHIARKWVFVYMLTFTSKIYV